MIVTRIERMTSARIPTELGTFQLCYYRTNFDTKEHLALVAGDVKDKEGVLVRVHSECFTGDVLGSMRCDCGPQLKSAMQLIAQEGAGILIYLRQEGRGIGLLDKLRSYNLQDEGFDTVEANLKLGHQADNRDYTVAALILEDLQIKSVRLMTNNPQKIESLSRLGIQVNDRIPLQTGVNKENVAYLRAKAEKMRHLLDLDFLTPPGNHKELGKAASHDGSFPSNGNVRPFITLSYAQSLDGSITSKRGQQLSLSGPESLEMTHRLRAEHDAILVGIGTVLADDPSLTTRYVNGADAQPIILDSHLRFPANARLLSNAKKPWIFTTNYSNGEHAASLETAGAKIYQLAGDDFGRVSLIQLMNQLINLGIRSVMVEGGAAIISSFLREQLVDRLVLTIAPILLGGLNPIENSLQGSPNHLPALQKPRYEQLGKDIIVLGEVSR